MQEVTKDRFFSLIYGRNLNVHPRCEPDASYWEIIGTRELFGKTTPGYKCEGRKAYFISEQP